MDMWYVLEAPRGSAASAQAAAEKKLKKQQQQRAAGHAKDGGADEEGVSEHFTHNATSMLLLEAGVTKGKRTVLYIGVLVQGYGLRVSKNRKVYLLLKVGLQGEQGCTRYFKYAGVIAHA